MYEKTNTDHGNKGEVCILKPERLSEPYRQKEYQLFRVMCGFGADPEASGNACFGYYCADGEEARRERFEFIGVADDETQTYANELEKKWKTKA